MSELYSNIKMYRKEKNMTQDELARRMGYTDRSSIAKIENGTVDLPISKIVQLAEVFGVDPGELMGWVDVTEEEKKDNDIIANVVARMSTDRVFFNFVETVYRLSADKLKDFIRVLELFLKNG